MQVCFVCACTKKDSVHVDVFNTESDKKGRGRYCGEGRVFAHNRASFVESQLLTRLQGAVLLVMNTAASPVYVY